MYEVDDTREIDGISILVGTAACNARCAHCAGKQHRPNAPAQNGEIDAVRVKEVLDLCQKHSCRSITLTGSGEPTLSPKSVTGVLRLIHQFPELKTNDIKLYTNGIRIGNDKAFCKKYLPLWRMLGLASIAISAHSHNAILNAQGFGIPVYPPFPKLFKRIKSMGFRLRVSLILTQHYIDSRAKLREACEYFFSLSVDTVSAWPLKNPDDSLSPLAPSWETLIDMQNLTSCYPLGSLRVLLGNSQDQNTLGQKIALFQNGEISNVWCARK